MAPSSGGKLLPKEVNVNLLDIFIRAGFPSRAFEIAAKEIDYKTQEGTIDVEVCRTALSACAIASLQQHHQMAIDLACEVQERLRELLEKQSPEVVCNRENVDPELCRGRKKSLYICSICLLQHCLPQRAPLMQRLETTLLFAQSFGIVGIEKLYLGENESAAEYLAMAHAITVEAHASVVHRHEVPSKISELFKTLEKILCHNQSNPEARPMTVPTSVGNRPPITSVFDAQRSSTVPSQRPSTKLASRSSGVYGATVGAWDKKEATARNRWHSYLYKIRPPKAQLPDVFRIKLKGVTDAPLPGALEVATEALRGHSQARRLDDRLGSHGHVFTNRDVVESSYTRIKTAREMDADQRVAMTSEETTRLRQSSGSHTAPAIQPDKCRAREIHSLLAQFKASTGAVSLAHMGDDAICVKPAKTTERVVKKSYTGIAAFGEMFQKKKNHEAEEPLPSTQDEEAEKVVEEEQKQQSQVEKNALNAFLQLCPQPLDDEAKRKPPDAPKIGEFERWLRKLQQNDEEEPHRFDYDFVFRHCRDPHLFTMKSHGLPIRRTNARHLQHSEMATVFRYTGLPRKEK